MHVATRRLITASEGLDPASRALLNIWIHQDLDDEAIARLSGMSTASVDERRRVIVEKLASELGASPDDVRGAIERLAQPAEAEPEAAPATNGDGPMPAAVLDGASAAAGTAQPEQDSARLGERAHGRRRRRAVLVASVVAVLAAAAIIAALGSGGRAAKKQTSTATAPSPPSGPGAQSLRPLPGAPSGIAGTVALSGSPAHTSMRIAVTGLAAPAPGHYEVWLYNSILDCVPLGRVMSGGSALEVTLPANYARYRYLDVSLQPPGANPHHSGQSVLRAAAAR